MNLDFSDLHLRTLSEPREVPISYIEQNPIYPLLIHGIVNPNGPTLTLIAAVRDGTSAPVSIVYSYLNPFQSEAFILGYLFAGNLPTRFADQLLAALDQIKLFEGGVATLYFKSQHFDELDIRHIYTSLLDNYDALGIDLDRLNRFPLNPWDRVSEEMSDAFSGLVDNPGGSSQRQVKEPGTTPDIKDAFLNVVLDKKHNQEELKAFLYAWNGSIEQQKKHGNKALAESAFGYKEFTQLLSYIVASAGIDLDG